MATSLVGLCSRARAAAFVYHPPTVKLMAVSIERIPLLVCRGHGQTNVSATSEPDVKTERDAVADAYPQSWDPSHILQWVQDDIAKPEVPKAVAVEFMAQVMFNFMSCSAVATAMGLANGSGILMTLQVMTFHFFLLYILVGGTMEISGGHFNPMVSVVMTYMRVIPPVRLVTYIPAQLLGSVLGSTLQFQALSPAVRNAAHAGIQMVPQGKTEIQAFLGETTAAFILMTVICFYGLDPKGDPKKIPLVIALTIPLLIYTVGPVSSMCINPARAFGPAVASGFWEHHWIWWTAPFLGGFLACVPYRWFLDTETRKP